MPTTTNNSRIALQSTANIWSSRERPNHKIESVSPTFKTISAYSSLLSMWVVACFRSKRDQVVQRTRAGPLLKPSNIREVLAKAQIQLEDIKSKRASIVFIEVIGILIMHQILVPIFQTLMDRLQKIRERTNSQHIVTLKEVVIRICNSREECHLQTQSQR